VITVVGLGPGEADAVPAAALRALAEAPVVLAPPLPEALGAALTAALGAPPQPMPALAELPPAAAIAAPDAEAHRLAVGLPDALTLPDREALRARAIGAQVARLATVALELRRECPWDREQTAATIVPHTIEEAFEVAEALPAGDGDRSADELGDLLFQTVFLAQLLEEQGPWDLGSVAAGQAAKLVSRHPHVYGEAVAADASGVVDLWERRKRDERAGQGLFHDLPPGLPALAYATKAQKRAAAAGFDFASADDAREQLERELEELRAEPGARELGDVLFACVAMARRLGADPELALRASADRFRRRVERAAALAAEAGQRFEDLDPARQAALYRRAKAEA
jgi:MazG family protein